MKLTRNEQTLFNGLASGLTLPEIAAELGRHPDTVKLWGRQFRRRIGAPSLTAAVAQVQRERLGPPNPVLAERVRPEAGRSKALAPIQKRARRAIKAIQEGADPELALFYTLFPPKRYRDAA